jgi:hypothetical protein
LRYEARLALAQGIHKNYGLKVVEVLASTPYLDPKRAEMLTIRQQGMVDDVKIRVDADNTFTKEKLDMQLQGFKGAGARDEDTLQKQHERQQAFLDAANEGLKQNMLRDISEGIPPEILVRRYPQFAQLLGFPAGQGALPSAHEQPLLKKVPSNPSDADADILTGSFTIMPQPSTPVPATTPLTTSAPQPFYNVRIGAWLVYTTLSNRQRQSWGVSNQIAFMVYALDADGAAEKGFMMPGDMIIEVNDQPIQAEKVLINTLDASQSGTQLSMRVLRGGLPYDLDLDIP